MKKLESGRTALEILSVISIIIALTIASIIATRHGINSLKANEIIETAHKIFVEKGHVTQDSLTDYEGDVLLPQSMQDVQWQNQNTDEEDDEGFVVKFTPPSETVFNVIESKLGDDNEQPVIAYKDEFGYYLIFLWRD